MEASSRPPAAEAGLAVMREGGDMEPLPHIEDLY